jgi:hypothetical protein
MDPTSSNNPTKGFTGFTRNSRGGLERSRFVQPVPPVSPLVAPLVAPSVPDYGNQVIQSMELRNGLATIESLTASPFTLNAPALEDPMGSLSQQVQRKKAQLSIAK